LFPSSARIDKREDRELTVENSAITNKPFNAISRRISRIVIIMIGIQFFFSKIIILAKCQN
jgi:hypothetical protein